MALLGDSSSVVVKKICIGANRYSSNRGKASYLNCVDSYPDSEDNSGEFGIQFRINYDEFTEVKKHNPGLLSPVVVVLEGQFVTFAGEQRFQPTKLLSAHPYKAAQPKPEPAK